MAKQVLLKKTPGVLVILTFRVVELGPWSFQAAARSEVDFALLLQPE